LARTLSRGLVLGQSSSRARINLAEMVERAPGSSSWSDAVTSIEIDASNGVGAGVRQAGPG
jgi:hypothetical protein